MSWGLIAGMAIPVVIILWLVGMYNGLVRRRVRVQEGWAQIDVQLKRRYDLIPNLVETVKGYAKHESGVFERVTQARTAAVNAQGVKAQGEADNMLSGALKSLFAVAEAYPDLKANQNFLALQSQLEGTENRINVARTRYNKAVQTFNTSIRVFPNNLTNMFLLKLPQKEPFKAEAGAEKAPKVKF